MNLTVLGGSGAWPPAGGACSGYLVEHGGYRLLIDPGYAVLPRLLRRLDAIDVDAVLISHGHPDHCADLNPLLRARHLRDGPAHPLPIHALPGAVDGVLALDRPGMLSAAYRIHDIEPGRAFGLGPFSIDTRSLPHSRPNVGFRVAGDGRTLAYTGDAGPDPALVELARGADVLLAEASYVETVPADNRGTLSSARDAGRAAAEAGVRALVLTHLMPGTDRRAARRAARHSFESVRVARPGLAVELA